MLLCVSSPLIWAPILDAQTVIPVSETSGYANNSDITRVFTYILYKNSHAKKYNLLK